MHELNPGLSLRINQCVDINRDAFSFFIFFLFCAFLFLSLHNPTIWILPLYQSKTPLEKRLVF